MVKTLAGTLLGVDPDNTGQLLRAVMQKIKPPPQQMIPLPQTQTQTQTQPKPQPIPLYIPLPSPSPVPLPLHLPLPSSSSSHTVKQTTIRPRSRIGRDIITKKLLDAQNKDLRDRMAEHVTSLRVNALSEVVGKRTKETRT